MRTPVCSIQGRGTILSPSNIATEVIPNRSVRGRNCQRLSSYDARLDGFATSFDIGAVHAPSFLPEWQRYHYSKRSPASRERSFAILFPWYATCMSILRACWSWLDEWEESRFKEDGKMAWQWCVVWLVGGGLGELGGNAWGEARDAWKADKRGQQTPEADVQGARELVVQKTNAFRQQHGLEDLKRNPQLMQTAQDFAVFMARTSKYGHTADGQWASQRARAHGYAHRALTENIAYQYSAAGFTTEKLADGFVTGWKNSRTHRRNMLDPEMTETGVGVAYGPQSGAYFAVQLFGRPASKEIESQVTRRREPFAHARQLLATRPRWDQDNSVRGISGVVAKEGGRDTR